jgi:NAD(P)H-dependent FMN reductase
MSPLKIAVIIGSTRPGRKGRAVAEWVLEHAQGRPGASYELIDLIDHPLPHLDEPVPASAGRYQQDHTRRWAETIAAYDGFIFVTPEYNHSTTGVLKNAIDYLHNEWHNKAAAFVGYGVVGAARAVEHLRGILSEVQVAHVRQAMAFSFFSDFQNFSEFTPGEHHLQYLPVMLDQLEAWADALKPLRERSEVSAA